WLRDQVGEFREQYATQKAVDEVRAIGRAYAENEKKIKEVRDFLKAQLKHVRGEEETLFTEAAKAIRAELHHDTISRLDTFLEQARQAAKQEKNKGKADKTASELLSMAVTGWLLGGNSAEGRAETARKLWTARKLVLAYLKADTDAERKKALADFASAKNTLSIEEV